MGNGCGGEGGFSFKKLKEKLKKLPFVDPYLLDSLYQKIEDECCEPHDDDYERGGGIKEFFKANYDFCVRLMGILHWTSTIGRIGILIFVFTGLTFGGIRYFNWKFTFLKLLWRKELKSWKNIFEKCKNHFMK